MKRKLFAAFVVLGAVSFTSCQEDTTMEELMDDNTELESLAATGGGNGEGHNNDHDPTGN